jgi:hypothetical protein
MIPVNQSMHDNSSYESKSYVSLKFFLQSKGAKCMYITQFYHGSALVNIDRS